MFDSKPISILGYKLAVFAATALLIAVIACNSPSGPVGHVNVVITVPRPMTPTSTEPSATQTPAIATASGDVPTIPLDSSAPQADVTWEGISFYLDLDLLSGWTSEIVPREAPEANRVFWIMPSHYRFDFQGYPVANDTTEPRLWMIPVRNFEDGHPWAETALGPVQAELALLRTLLAERQPDLSGLGEALPAMPLFTGRHTRRQIIRAQVAYLEFTGGKGLRYITQHNDIVWPINNRELFYTYQGLTDDGQYYVAVRMPITHPGLLDRVDPENPPAEFMAALDTNDPISYLQPIVDLLNAADPSDFQPDLTQLDAFVQSIRIDRNM